MFKLFIYKDDHKDIASYMYINLLPFDNLTFTHSYIYHVTTCCNSALVLLNNSTYLFPMFSLCFFNASCPSASVWKRTNASPVGLPSGCETNITPSSSWYTLGDSPKNLTYESYCQQSIVSVLLIDDYYILLLLWSISYSIS